MKVNGKGITWVIGILVLVIIAGCVYGSHDSIAAYFDGLTAQEPLTKEQKLADFDYMYGILKENYPFFWVNQRMNHIDWLGKKEEYRARIVQAKSDVEFKKTLNGILAELNNGHTGMIDRSFYIFMYEGYMTDKDGNEPWVKVLSDPKVQKRYSYIGNQNAAGPSKENPSSRSIGNNIKTDIIEQGKAAYLRVKTMDPFCMDGDREKLYKFFQSIKDYKALIIDIRGNSGGATDYWGSLIVPPLINKEIRADFYILSRGGDYGKTFYDHRLTAIKTLDVKAMDQSLIAKFPPEVKDNFKYCKIAPFVINPEKPVGFKGKIFLLVDGQVYSSSEAFAAFCKQSGFATLIGAQTGGDGIGVDPMVGALPNSGYVFRFSTVLGLNPDGTANEETKTIPDIVVNDASIGSLNNDKCVQEALRHIK